MLKIIAIVIGSASGCIGFGLAGYKCYKQLDQDSIVTNQQIVNQSSGTLDKVVKQIVMDRLHDNNDSDTEIDIKINVHVQKE